MQPLVGTRRTYRINLKYPLTGGWETRDVQGYKVIIPGFEEFDFFVHRGPERLILTENPWRISEVTTGFAFPRETDGATRQKAIDNVSRFLSEKGKEKFIRAMEKANIAK